MAFSQDKFLVLLSDNGVWCFEEVDSREEVTDLLEAHKEAALVRFAVVTSGGNAAFDRRCEAITEAKAKKVQVSLMQPHRSLPNEAQVMYYSAL